MTSQGMLLVISGPAGVGKTTITHEVERILGASFSISLTTRPQSDQDIPGVDYQFVTREQFIKERDAGKLLEWAEVYGNFYGTPRAPVEKALAEGRIMILEIDVQGALQIKAKLPCTFALFVLPPNEETLLDRLRNRKREDEISILKRFDKAKEEIAKAKSSGAYDAFLVNDKLQQAIDDAVKVVRAELNRREKA